MTAQEKYIFEVIKSARKIQNFLWGEHNKKWTIEEWQRMFRKRIVTIDEIDPKNPHAFVELRKRLLQNAALCVALLEELGKGKIKESCTIPSNLPQYKKTH